MPVSFEFLRGAMGVIGIGCAFMMGRTMAAVRKGWMKPTRITAWILRVFVCLAALVVRHPVDNVAIAVWALSAAALAGGWIVTARQKPPEDLTNEIFPDQ
ncbi:MAG TPA: hypothetical protein VKB88_31720 [Bryobacteraceae bacterium]|nr:hypothetical protein [Bryobacteraceae bacterium]